MLVPLTVAAGLALVAALAGWGLAGIVDRFASRPLRQGAFALLLVLSLLPITMHYQAEVKRSLWGLQEITENGERYGEAVLRASTDATLRYTWGVLIGGLVLVAAGVVAANQWPVLGALAPGVALVLYLIAIEHYEDAFVMRNGALIGDGDILALFLTGRLNLIISLLTGVAQVGLLAFAGRLQFGPAVQRLPWLEWTS
jgi:hypothetical protein